MKLSSRHVLVRVAYYYSAWTVPTHISLCQLFWRVVLGAVVFPILMLAPVGLLGLLLYNDPMVAFAALGIMGIGGSIAFLVIVIANLNQKRLGIIALAFSGIKQRFCPIIEIERGNN